MYVDRVRISIHYCYKYIYIYMHTYIYSNNESIYEFYVYYTSLFGNLFMWTSFNEKDIYIYIYMEFTRIII